LGRVRTVAKIVYNEDILDWETVIEPAPPRPSGWIEVTLEFGGLSRHAIEEPKKEKPKCSNTTDP